MARVVLESGLTLEGPDLLGARGGRVWVMASGSPALVVGASRSVGLIEVSLRCGNARIVSNEHETTPSGHEARIVVQVTGGSPACATDGTLEVQTRSVGRCRVPIRFCDGPQGNLTLSGSRSDYYFGDSAIPIGHRRPTPYSVNLKNTGSADVVIDGIEISQHWLRVRNTPTFIAPGSVDEVTLEIDGDSVAPGPPKNARVTVRWHTFGLTGTSCQTEFVVPVATRNLEPADSPLLLDLAGSEPLAAVLSPQRGLRVLETGAAASAGAASSEAVDWEAFFASVVGRGHAHDSQRVARAVVAEFGRQLQFRCALSFNAVAAAVPDWMSAVEKRRVRDVFAAALGVARDQVCVVERAVAVAAAVRHEGVRLASPTLVVSLCQDRVDIAVLMLGESPAAVLVSATALEREVLSSMHAAGRLVAEIRAACLAPNVGEGAGVGGSATEVPIRALVSIGAGPGDERVLRRAAGTLGLSYEGASASTATVLGLGRLYEAGHSFHREPDWLTVPLGIRQDGRFRALVRAGEHLSARTSAERLEYAWGPPPRLRLWWSGVDGTRSHHRVAAGFDLSPFRARPCTIRVRMGDNGIPELLVTTTAPGAPTTVVPASVSNHESEPEELDPKHA